MVRFVDVCSVLVVGTVVGGTLCGQNLGVSLKNRGAKFLPLWFLTSWEESIFLFDWGNFARELPSVHPFFFAGLDSFFAKDTINLEFESFLGLGLFEPEGDIFRSTFVVNLI